MLLETDMGEATKHMNPDDPSLSPPLSSNNRSERNERIDFTGSEHAKIKLQGRRIFSVCISIRVCLCVSECVGVCQSVCVSHLRHGSGYGRSPRSLVWVRHECAHTHTHTHTHTLYTHLHTRTHTYCKYTHPHTYI